MKGGHVGLRGHKAWLLAGLTAALVPALALPHAPALSQTAANGRFPVWSTTTAPSQPRRPSTPPVLQIQEPLAPPGPLRRADPDDPVPDADVATSETPLEPTLPQDGVLEPVETPAPVDGLDPGTADTRDIEDIQAFQPPEAAAGYDPSVFSIEPDPTNDRRPERFFRAEPYAPTGVRVGSFLLFPEIELGGVAYSNVFRSSIAAQGDTAFEARPAARLVSNWAVHALEFGARGLTSFHNVYPSEDDRNYTLEARGRLDVTRRTNLEGSVVRDVTQESRGSINARSGSGDRTDVASERVGLALNHRFNRLSVQLRGSVTDRDFSPTTDDGGLAISNDDRDSTQRDAAIRASWTLKPELSVFGDVGIDEREYQAAARSDGIRRDSHGERYRVGVSFGATSKNVRGEVAVGAARQAFADNRLPELRGIIVDANVAWRISGLTSLLVTARSDIGESTLAGAGGAFTRTAGVEVRHAFRRHLIGTAGVALTRGSYEGAELVETDVTTQVGLEYFVARDVALFSRYAHIDFSTNTPSGNYAADEVRIGVRLRK